MEPRHRAISSGRPRAPTITVDESAIHSDGENDILSTPQSSKNDPNALNVPTSKPRSDSWDSSKSTTITDVGSGDRLLGTKPDSSHETQNPNDNIFRPNPGEEHLFNIENNPFAFSPGQLGKLINPKNLAALVALGGLPGLEKGLRTDRRAGLSSEEGYFSEDVTFEEATAPSLLAGRSTSTSHHEPSIRQQWQQSNDKQPFSQRKRVFGDNRLPERKSKSLLQLAWIALQDHVLILLSVAAVVSLALGLYQTFGQTHHEGAKVEWVEGVAIIVAIAIVVIVGALNDWQKERQFRNLNRKKEDRLVKVIRSGKPTTISIHDVLVGDVMMLEPGDVIPVDGVFIDGHNLSCDESSATGESDLIKKVAADAVLQSVLNKDAPRIGSKSDPFIISGAKVLDGVGSFVVTAVGQNSSHGRTIMSLRDDPGLTPLQSKLNLLAGYIAKIGGGAGCLLFIVLLIEFLARLPRNDETPEEKGQNFLRILITSITIIVVAVPEGLPLAVTLSLAFATKRMTKENNLVRHLQSCETMGNATVICSDKTGTLTENIMTVVSGALGNEARFRFGDGAPHAELEIIPITSPADPEKEPESRSNVPDKGKIQPQHVTIDDLSKKLDREYQELFKTAIAVNTTAFEGEESGKQVFIGTKTESALLDWARRCFALGPVAIERSNQTLQQLFPFSSQRKCMGAVIVLPPTHEHTGRAKKYRLFVKGAPEIVLAQCSKTLDDPTTDLSSLPLSESQRESIKRVIFSYATRSLRTLALAYRDFEEWPPHKLQKDSSADNTGEVAFQDIFNDMTWMGVVGIQDPVRQGVVKAVGDCRTASVSVKMVTGDNIETARAIARECGILAGSKGLVMEGQEFRRLTDEERSAVVKELCVLARSSPEDKRILVKTLRSFGEIVAVTGDGTNDAPALKAADVGFSMGVTGTEVAKEASDIILMDDNFSSIVKALSWGRAINDSVKKFLQFQLTVNITAVIITFVSAVSDDEETSVLNAVQLLWVNLIMDTFAALALATDPPTGSLLHRMPEPRTAPLITITMWKMIIGQSIYQLIVCFVLWFAGPSFLGYPEPQLRTLIFNVFVFMQIFKLVNSRRIDNRLNIFEGLHRNHLFMLMMSIMLGGQIIIIYFGGDAFVVVKLTGAQWGISVVLGFFSIPIGVLIRLFPDSWIRSGVDKLEKHWPSWLRLRAMKKKSEREEEPLPNIENYDMDAALLGIRDDLEFLRKIRGGRIGALSDALARSREAMFMHRPRSASRRSGGRSRGASSVSSIRPQISPMRSVVGLPGIVAASVGGLSPGERHPPAHHS